MSAYLPALHWVHECEPSSSLNLPTGQSRQLDAFERPWYVPAVQSVQVAWPAADDRPAWQSVQLPALADEERPAGQVEQLAAAVGE